MATYTSYLNLEKFTTGERLDVLKINANSDKIDNGVSELNSNISTLLTRVGNIKSVKLVSDTVATGASGNIATNLPNTGKIIVFGGYASGTNAVVIPFVSGVNNLWYLKVRDADTMTTINNTSVAIRYYVLEMV